MTTITAFIKRHPVLTYVALVFAISYSGLVIVVGPSNFPIPAAQFAALGPVVYLVILAGPTIAGLLLTGLVAGRAGYRELLARLLRWRVGARWYAVALLATPLVVAAVNFALSLRSPAFLPAIVTADDKVSLLLVGIVVGLLFGIFEELGWTGFAVPQLRRWYGIVPTALIVGVVWGAWHFLLFWERDSFAGALPLALLLVQLFAWLPAYRVLLVWVYDRTESLLLVMLMHASLSASQLTLRPLTVTGVVPQLTGMLVWAAAWWAVVAVVALATHGHLTRPALRPRAA